MPQHMPWEQKALYSSATCVSDSAPDEGLKCPNYLTPDKEVQVE